MTIAPKMLADLEAAGARTKAAEAERQAASSALAKQIKRAAKAKVPKADIARAAGVSRQTVHTLVKP